jgi:Fe-S oxidoreductase/nitrate reductase gamma subunit
VIVIAVELIGIAAFLWTMRRYIGVLMRGRPHPRPLRDLGKRVGDVVLYFFMQRSVAREGLSWHHLPIFWGFLIITAASAEMMISGALPGVSFALLGPTLSNAIRGAVDVTNLLVLITILYAVLRRLLLRPRLLPFNFEAGLILGLIGALCLSHFLMHGYFGHTGYVGAHHAPSSMLISSWVQALSAGTAPGTAIAIYEVNYWLHLGMLFFFLNYLPYSKHIHLLGALPNILTRNRSQPGIMPKLDLEDETQWGVGRYEQFTWKSLLDTYACTECARCSNNCPAFTTGKPLSPMHLIHDIRYEMLERGDRLRQLTPGVNVLDPGEGAAGPTAADKVVLDQMAAAPPMTGGRIKDETLWACTTCGACEAVCPVFIEHPIKILQMRTHLVLTEERVPQEVARMLRGIENNQNPWGIGSDKRMDWAKGLDVPTMEQKGGAEYLAWIGCAGCYDDRGRKISRAWVQLLQRAGVDFAVLGPEEGCTGDAARRAGNEYLFQTMAQANVELFQQYKVKRILTTCPHCFHSFKNEYPQFGGSYEVWHHSEFLQKLIKEGRLEAPRSHGDKSVTYHDPCYLGRWNSIYEEPRLLLSATTGSRPIEMGRNGYKSFCCGAGGAHMWMEEDGERVNLNRTKEAVATGAKTIATACPFCNVMVTDGVKALDKEDEIEVKDLAELLLEALPALSTSATPTASEDRSASNQ